RTERGQHAYNSQVCHGHVPPQAEKPYSSPTSHTIGWISVDGTMSMFGTVNLDMRSLWLNYEVALFIYHLEFAEALCALQKTYIGQSARLDPADWATRPVRQRFFENALRLFSPLL